MYFTTYWRSVSFGGGGVALAQLPDYKPEPPSAAHQYYVNQGQLRNSSGDPVPEIQYYTERTSPGVFLAQDRVSLVYHKVDTAYWSDPLAARTDTSYRLDLRFVCNPPRDLRERGYSDCARLRVEEPGNDRLNYFLPHCGPSGVTQVRGYQRVIYQDAFPNIDVHFYSNSMGLKTYFVIDPGGDPDDILLQFSGQDSLGTLMTGDLEMFLADKKWVFPQATAYQIIGGSTTPLAWLPTWIETAPGQVSLTTGSYDSSRPLVIRVAWPVGNLTANGCSPDWSVFYGDDQVELNTDVAVDANENVFVLSEMVSSQFPALAGEQDVNPTRRRDVYISRFEADASRTWGTYFGGDGFEFARRLVPSDNGKVYIAGYTTSEDLPFPPVNNGTFIQGSYGGGFYDAFVVSLFKSDGFRDWVSYFGGDGDELAWSIDLSDATDKLYLVGEANASSSVATTCGPGSVGAFPLCAGSGSRYYQSSVVERKDGFIAEFDLNTHALLWSTYFGGEGSDMIYDVLPVSPSELTGAIFIGGRTRTKRTPAQTTYPQPVPTDGSFPLVDPVSGGADYFQSSPGLGDDGFIVKFNNAYRREWATFFGGEGSEAVSDLAINSKNEIFATGVTGLGQNSISSCTAVTTGEFPICNGNGSSYIQSNFGGGTFDVFLAQFNYFGQLKWSTFFGGASLEQAPNLNISFSNTSLVIDSRDNLFLAGTTQPSSLNPSGKIPTQSFAACYYQPDNAAITANDAALTSDAFIASFDPGNQLRWSTHFGGSAGNLPFSGAGHETGNGLAVFQDQRLYLVGSTRSALTPYAYPGAPAYDDPTLNGQEDGFITRLCIDGLITNLDLETSAFTPALKVYPNPAQDQLHLEWKTLAGGEAQIHIYNHLGQSVLTQEMSFTQGERELSLDVSSLSTGYYTVKIETPQGTFSQSFIK